MNPITITPLNDPPTSDRHPFVQYNNTSILRAINLRDLCSINRLLHGLTFCMIGNKLIPPTCADDCPPSYSLAPNEKAVIDRIVHAAQRTYNIGYPLLYDAIMRFTDARNMDDETVTTAMEKLVGLASEDMLCCPETARNWHGYLRAFRDFEETVVEPETPKNTPKKVPLKQFVIGVGPRTRGSVTRGAGVAESPTKSPAKAEGSPMKLRFKEKLSDEGNSGSDARSDAKAETS